MDIRDSHLASALARGEQSAYRLLYQRHGPAMLRIATRILGRREDAEDAVQDAFVRLYRSAAAFKGRSSLSTWIYRIVVNTCLHELRQQRTRACLASADALSTEAPDPATSEAQAVLEREVAELPDRQRLVFTLAEIERISLTEVARILTLRPGTVRYHLFKARKQLQERLRPYLGSARPTHCSKEAPTA